MANWPARTYIQQLCGDTGCSLEDLPGAMYEISAGSSTWWWWWFYLKAIEPQSLPSSTSKIKYCWVFVFHKSNLKKYSRGNHIGAKVCLDQHIDRIEHFWSTAKPTKGQSKVSKVTWPLFLPGNKLLSPQDPFLQIYGSLPRPTRDLVKGPYLSAVSQLAYSSVQADRLISIKGLIYIYMCVCVCVCTPATLMTYRFWQIHSPSPNIFCIV